MRNRDDCDDRIEEAREEGRSESTTNAMAAGCLFGVLATLLVIYMGWCTPPMR